MTGIKQRRAWLLLGWVNAERSYTCKQPTCLAISGSELTFKALVFRLSVLEGVLALTSPEKVIIELFSSIDYCDVHKCPAKTPPLPLVISSQPND
ncbi:hypothetical protein J6590_091929 [Homalodisca vitripennis]|nr:hypothetical protein J6590_091929 [Homalodisca vitripennis]